MANVVITGGSRGIGAAAVALFAARGDRVTFLYEKAHAAARAVAEKTGAEAICCDVADGQAVRQAFARIGDVDILICNAGICPSGLMSQLPEDQFDRAFAVNVKGIYHCVNAAMPSFLQKHAGCIINMSSIWGRHGASCEVTYSSTKHAIIGLTRSLAAELAPSGIRVNAVAPGVIDTDMTGTVHEKYDKLLAAGEFPIARWGKPEDIANAVSLLVSEKLSYTTGNYIDVDGGFHIRRL